MDKIIEPKSTIYNKLKEITSIEVNEGARAVSVVQERPDEIVLDNLLMITFRINSNVPKYTLEKEVAKQDIEVAIDIWALSSIESGLLLIAVEEKMRELDYLLTFNMDIPDPKGYSHITTQFNF